MSEQDSVDPKLIAAENERQKLRDFVREKTTDELLTTAYGIVIGMEDWKLKTEAGKDSVFGDEPKLKFLIEAIKQIMDRLASQPPLESK
jgi:hypothetical protein